MGAHNLTDCGVGKTMREAYDNAVSYAENEYGHNAYNGTISTTEGFKDKTKKFEELMARKREGAYQTQVKEGEGWNVTFTMVEKNFKDMTEKEWYVKCVNDWNDEAWDNTHKWEEVWGALANKETNLHIFAGWAAE